MRRVLKQIAADAEEITGDITTLEDFSIVAKLLSDENFQLQDKFSIK